MKWFIKYKKENIEALQSVAGLSPLERVLLGNRGLREAKEVEAYLNPAAERLHDPFRFLQMETAVAAVVDCLSMERPIRIAGDYDQDGVAATTILVKGLRRFVEEMGADPYAMVSYAIPNRLEDGYGLNVSMVDEALEDGVGLLITCDNGIAAFEALTHAQERGLPVLVTDHHQIVVRDGEEVLPPAVAVLNPHSKTSGYPFADLCGAGVAYKLLEGLCVALGAERTMVQDLLQFAALGTICDVMPLVGENRTMVALGLQELNRRENPGLDALLTCCHWEKEVTTHTVGFVIGPCINASGRLFTARLGVELFLEEDPSVVIEYARQLVAFNEERKAMTRTGVAQAEAIVRQSAEVDDLLFLYLPEVHESICGLIAGRIKESYYRPTIVFTDAQTEDGEEPLLKGSGRSIPAYHMFEQLEVHRDEFVSFGGHAMACGLTIRKADFHQIHQALLSEVHLRPEEKIPTLDMDCRLDVRRLDMGVVETLQRFAPFGSGNPRPLFGEKNLSVRQLRLVGASKNVLQLQLEKEGRVFPAVLFQGDEKVEQWRSRYPEAINALLQGQPTDFRIDIVYQPEKNEFRGRVSLQLILKDARVSQ